MRSIAAEGPRGLLRGFVASSLRDAPYAGMFIVLYEGGKHKLCELHLVFDKAIS
jgi:solute carrier family 25 protein 38